MEWLLAVDIKVFLAIIIVSGFGFGSFVLWQLKKQSSTNSGLWDEVKEGKRLYHQVDKLTYGNAIAIKAATGIETMKQSADGKGDNALNRDV